MKKKYGSILLLIFIFLLAACNNESENESNTAEIEDVKKSEDNEKETTENEITEEELMSEDEIKATVEENLEDRKSTRLNSSHVAISYAVFCSKKKRVEE